MKEQCPHCHNVVVGQFSPSETRKWLTSLAKKGGMKAVLTAAGSIVPGLGNVGGFLAGTALDVIYGKDINKLIDKIADEFDDNKIYIFECPNCGHSWTCSEDENVAYNVHGNYNVIEGYESDGAEDEEMASQFDQSLSYFLNETDEIIKSESTIEAFMNKMNGYASQSQHYMRAAFHFLAAYAGLIYIKDGESDDETENIANRAISQIREAISISALDEYKLIERLLRIQISSNINDLVQAIRVASACKVNEGSWLKKKYYQKSLVPDVCFFKLVNMDQVDAVTDADKVTLWKTLVNSPIKDFRMYANLRVYILLSEDDESRDRFLNNAYTTKGFSLRNPEMGDTMYKQWLWAALEYAGRLYTGESSIIEENKTEGINMLHTIAELGDAVPCLSARLSLGKMAEEDGDLQKALVYYIKAGELGAADTIRLRKLLADNSKSCYPAPSQTTPSEVESEYLSELKACLEEGGEISKGERRLLEKLRIKLGISEENAAELEKSLLSPQLTDEEQEYLAEYKECLAEDGEISAGERRLLNRLRDKLGISEQRAFELEQID